MTGAASYGSGMSRVASLLVLALAACSKAAPFPSGPPPAPEQPSRVWGFPQSAPPPDTQVTDDPDAAAPLTPQQREAWARNADTIVRTELHRRARVCLAPTLSEQEQDYVWRVAVEMTIAPNGIVSEAHVMECLELMTSECECVATAAKSLHFASPGTTATRLGVKIDRTALR